MLLACLIGMAGCADTKVDSTTSRAAAVNAKLLSSEHDVQNIQSLQFHGYACTEDCSGHEAGYQWAEEHGINDRDDCPVDPHNSHSFTEGCWAYADEQNGDSSE